MTSITKNDNSGPHKIFNRKKMLNRFYFPPTLPHSTHIRLLCRAGYPTKGPQSKERQLRPTGEQAHELHHQERQLQPSQNIQQKKMLNRFISHLPSRIPPTFICGAGPDIQLRPLSKERQLRPSQNIQNDYISSPNFHSTHVHLWRRTGEPTHDLHHQERQYSTDKRC
ncbi:hypothetical protein TNCV_2858791 [Trichonephila clavipes]|nr:hypothetical protein TNCV_2858791 [Trichonephila clavipes]